MDSISIVAKAIKDELGSHTSITNLVGTNPKRIWLNSAPPKLENSFPYIQVVHVSGGEQNSAPYNDADIEMMITGISKLQEDAKELASLINLFLDRKEIDYSDGWESYSTIRQTGLVARVTNVQNEQYHQFGGYYRFRMTKGI